MEVTVPLIAQATPAVVAVAAQDPQSSNIFFTTLRIIRTKQTIKAAKRPICSGPEREFE
jgi:hypothetical protein